MGKKILIVVICILVIGLGIFSYFIFVPFSQGSRAGTIIKLSKKGIAFKTWEGELNSYMYVGDQSAASGANDRLFIFSVEGNEKIVLDVMQKAMLEGTRVQLFYKERYFKFPWNGDTKYFVYKAEVFKK